MPIIDDYLATLGAPERVALERIRQIVHDTASSAVEVKTYGMPGFKVDGKYLIAFAAFRDHMSIFPTAGPIAELDSELHDFPHAKGTVRFTLEHQLPEALIRSLIQCRLNQIRATKR